MNKKNGVEKKFNVEKFNEKYPVIDERYEFQIVNKNYDIEEVIEYKINKSPIVPINRVLRSSDYKCCDKNLFEIEVLHDLDVLKENLNQQEKDCLHKYYNSVSRKTLQEIADEKGLTKTRIGVIRNKGEERLKRQLINIGYSPSYEKNLF